MENARLHTTRAKQFRSLGGGSTIRAIHQHAQISKLIVRVRGEPLNVRRAKAVLSGQAGFVAGSGCDVGLSSKEKISRSIASSWESGSLKPSPEKTLMPLSVQGLWDAEMTTPASNLRERAR
jgi:hypothetical protein